MPEYKKEIYKINFYQKGLWDQYEKIELAWFAQDAKDNHVAICKELDIQTIPDVDGILNGIRKLKAEAGRAQTVLDDWAALNDHMDKNPTIKEEWEGLLMAIRLTEDD